MDTYEKSIYKFKALKEKFIQHKVLETDLPFLFENKNNEIGILLIHGSESTPCNTHDLGKILYAKGYNTLGVLLAGHGHNTERLHQGLISWKECYKSAIESLEILLALNKKVYVLGSSFGGCLAYLLGLEFYKNISGVIAVSAPSFTKYDPPSNFNWMKQVSASIKAVEHHIHNLEIPTLILHSSDDKTVKLNQALFAYEKIKTEQKKLIIYNSVGHSLGFSSNTEEVAKDIDNFIKEYNELIPIQFSLDANVHSVSVAGEFNNWASNENEMMFIDGKWSIDLLLPKKRQYQYKFVINGNNWILDPYAEKIATPLGNYNSLVRT
ncbi:MAG: alpha/beta hydrolase [Candidatus Sericytochromatia bacterium]